MRGNDNLRSRIYHLDLTAEEMLSLAVMAAVGIVEVMDDEVMVPVVVDGVDMLARRIGGIDAVANAAASAIAAINLQGARAVAQIKADAEMMDKQDAAPLTARTQFGFPPPGFPPPGSGPSSRG